MANDTDLATEANLVPTLNPRRVTVLYADYGKRKTTTACSMVNKRGLLLSTDDSWDVLVNERHKELAEKITVVDLKGLSQLKYIKFDDYDTVIWDTMSGSVDRFLDLVYAKATWAGKYREKLSVQSGVKDEDLKDLALLSPMDYRLTRDVLRPHVDFLLRSTNAHLIVTSQVKEATPLDKNSITRPDVPASSFKLIGTRANLIGYITPAGRGKFQIDLNESSQAFIGKSRIEGLQDRMDLDTFIATYKRIVFGI